jgi:hypothetical protein
LIVTLLGCGSCVVPDVRTDFDPSADFARFKTYAFGGLTDLNQGGVLDNSLLRKRLEHMVTQQLTMKGLQQVGLEQHPDLLVHYWVGVAEKQRVERTGSAAGAGARGSGYGYRNVTTYEYKEGTLVVDLVEAGKKELVWRASVVETLRGSAEKNMEIANEGIAKAFQAYPPGKR